MRSNSGVVDEAVLPGAVDEFFHLDPVWRGDLVDADDFLDQADVTDYLALPRSVADVLAEVELFGPGAEAVILLESLQGRAMTSDDALSVAEAWERQARWMSVRCAQANLAFVGVRPETQRDRKRAQASRVLELGLVTDTGDAFLSQVLLPQARCLATTLAATRSLVETGRLSAYRARLICDRLRRLDPAVARDIEARVLPTAASIKLASLGDKLRRLVHDREDPTQAAAAFRDAAQRRRVDADPEAAQPGLVGVHALLPTDAAAALMTALETQAARFLTADETAVAAGRCPRCPGTPTAAADAAGAAGAGCGCGQPRVRTRDQRMADALAWYVLGPDPADASRPARPRFLVQLTMSLPVLLALREGAAYLPGYGPIPADVARAWAADAAFQRFVHDPVDGHLLDDGHRSYRPKARLRRFLRHRDATDRFPGSNRRAEHCDADHLRPFTGDDTGGPTSAANLASTGRPGHLAKTHNGWTVTGEANGILTYRSPHGRDYPSTPHDYRDPGSPPF